MMCGYVMNHDRAHFVDFSQPLFENRVGNYVNGDLLPEMFDWFFFARIFRPSAWLNVVGLFAAIAAVKWTFRRLGVPEDSNKNKLIQFLLWTLFLLCQAYYWYYCWESFSC